MKSVDYFRNGLPIINNIPADTENFVREQQIGIQLDENCVERILSVTTEDALRLRKNVSYLFAREFDRTVIAERLQKLLDGII